MYQCAKVVARNTSFRKMIDYRDYSDLAIVLDASGGTGTAYHPHFQAHSRNDIQRHDLLKVISVCIAY
jgi:hypothetical protein